MPVRWPGTQSHYYNARVLLTSSTMACHHRCWSVSHWLTNWEILEESINSKQRGCLSLEKWIYKSCKNVRWPKVHLLTRVCLVKAMVFPVVMYGCESWTVKKAECRRIDAFELWCWRRLLRVPWTARRSNQSILKEINPGCSLEGLMLKLKLQYFGHLMWRADSSEKTLMLGKIGGRKGRGRQRMRRLEGIPDSMDMGLGGLRELVMNREAWRAVAYGVA